MGRPDRQEPHVSPRLARLTSWLVALAVGMGGNLVSADIGYRGVAVTFAVCAILAAAGWLRGFKPDFVLVVWMVRGFLLIAVAAVVAATMVSTALSGVAVLVAALATLAATLIRSDPIDRLALLGAVVLIGLGVGFLADGISSTELTGNGRFFTIVMGVLLMMLGIGAMGQGRLVVDFAKIAVEVLLDHPIFYVLGVLAPVGVLVAANGDVLPAVAMILMGVGAVGMAAGHNRRRPVFVGLGAMFVGTAWALIGIWGITDGEALLGAAAAGMGVTIIVAGFTYLSRRGVLGRLRNWLEAAKRDG